MEGTELVGVCFLRWVGEYNKLSWIQSMKSSLSYTFSELVFIRSKTLCSSSWYKGSEIFNSGKRIFFNYYLFKILYVCWKCTVFIFVIKLQFLPWQLAGLGNNLLILFYHSLAESCCGIMIISCGNLHISTNTEISSILNQENTCVSE